MDDHNLKRKIHIVILFFLSISASFSQEPGGYKIPDSLKNISFNELRKRAYSVPEDTTLSLIYWHTFIEKAKQGNKKIRLADGYCSISEYQVKDELKLQYLDSAIVISKDLNNPNYPAIPYSLKGGHHYFKSNFKEALQNFFLSMESAKENNSEFYEFVAKRSIAVIKRKIGKYEEALTGFKECLEFTYGDDRKVKDTLSYLYITLDIAEIYTAKRVLDSSTFYVKKGIQMSKNGSDVYDYFVFNEGVNHFYRGNYDVALDSIQKSLSFISNQIDKNYILNAYLHLGKIYDRLDESDSAKYYYQKVDSVYQSTNNVSSEVREAYNALVKHYKEEEDTPNQLLYIEKLLKFDSILQSDYKELDDILIKQYDTPQLLAEKERLVQEATRKSSRYGSYILLLIVSVLLFIGLFSYQFYRRRLYQKRFERLTQKRNSSQEPKEEILTKEKEIPASDIAISESIVEEVLSKLEVFEEKKGFTSTKITLTKLSSDLGTNNKYLSKIINIYKEKSFSQYINDLRIDYIVNRLQEDKKLRNYTIKAIARETGFNTAEVFSKAFYGKHGIYPSYFIKKLEKL